MKKAVGEKRFLLANGFNHAQLKNRITMMQNTSHAAWKKYSALLVLPLLAATLLLLAECKPSNKNVATEADETTAVDNAATEVTVTDEPEEAIEYGLVEVKPTFQDGDANAFSLWVNENLKYPDAAKEAQVQGRVTLQFTVDKEGNVKDVKVMKGVDPALDGEAVRVVSQSPKWNPGMQNGEPVNVTYMFPVVYKLR